MPAAPLRLGLPRREPVPPRLLPGAVLIGQIVTRHGKEVVVVVGIDEYRRLRGETKDFKQFLLEAPPLHELEIERDRDPGPDIEL